ncbi:MAG TPA: LemA family protein [Tepidisphaeraceae bacterium]|jgi:LemA protein|nr:LemA family protein [Tepidisphaeraceae bacterium]
MKKPVLAILGVIVVVILLGVLTSIVSYNHLVSSSQQVNSQWAQVQNVYQRRADLIPNLVETVKGSANFEKSTLEAVTNARASVGKINLDTSTAPSDPGKLAEFQQAQANLTGALSRLLVVSEKYPDLKTTQNFRDLQAQIEGSENRISVERGRFNDAVQAYNTSVHSFPTAIFAGAFGFKDKPYFMAADTAQAAPAVHFDSGK